MRGLNIWEDPKPVNIYTATINSYHGNRTFVNLYYCTKQTSGIKAAQISNVDELYVTHTCICYTHVHLHIYVQMHTHTHTLMLSLTHTRTRHTHATHANPHVHTHTHKHQLTFTTQTYSISFHFVYKTEILSHHIRCQQSGRQVAKRNERDLYLSHNKIT